MQIEKVKLASTPEEARDFAIAWQLDFENQNYDTMDLCNWASVFEELGKRFDLTDEFKENGII